MNADERTPATVNVSTASNVWSTELSQFLLSHAVYNVLLLTLSAESKAYVDSEFSLADYNNRRVRSVS
jgi:hypothetical protein